MNRAQKRLAKDFKALQESPLANATAVPLENNLFVWHLNFFITLNVQGTATEIPLHAILSAPTTYPQDPPNVGFCNNFPYNLGAEYIDSKPGPLNGLKVICLSILGNFAFVHTEWKAQEGTGWSPSMSIETVLVQLQSILVQLDDEMNDNEKRKLISEVKKYSNDKGDCKHTFNNPWPKNVSVAEVMEIQKRKKIYSKIPKQFHRRMNKFIDNNLNGETKHTEPFMSLLNDILDEIYTDSGNTKKTSYEDDSIVCYISSSSYQEEILGYGLWLEKKTLKTPAELLSYKSFDVDGIRLTSQKMNKLTHWLPAFINKTHINHKGWYDLCKERLQTLASLLSAQANKYNYGGGPRIKKHYVLDVLPNLINSLLIEVLKGDKAAAISFFEALCSFWRTLRYFCLEGPDSKQILSEAMKRLKSFCQSEDGRHKDNCPDIGQLLALYTALTDKVPKDTFISSYLRESSVRSVMWWGCPAQDTAVFQATKVGRGLFAGQLTLIREIIGKDPNEACLALDQSCGKLTSRLDSFQQRWKKLEPSITNWKEYFVAVQAPENYYLPILKNINGWLNYLTEQSVKKGPKYQKRKTYNNNRNYNNRSGGYGGGRGGGRGGGYRRGGYRGGYRRGGNRI